MTTRPLLLAVVVSAVLVAAAPFIGEFRRWLSASVPGYYLTIINGGVALSVLAVAWAAMRSIRADHVRRFALVGLAAIVAVVFAVTTGSNDPRVAAVEHFHFVQYGTITWLFYRAFVRRHDAASVVWPVVIAFIFGIAEEWWQWFLPARVGEINDVLLNLVAILTGVLVSLALRPLQITRDAAGHHRLRLKRCIGPGALATACAVWFVWVVHVGHNIADDDIGLFRSRYTAAQLVRLSTDRLTQWAADPPLVRKALAAEDQYRSEGEAHVRARNAAWEQGDHARAWAENLILERYYAAVLDTPSHISRTGHRWHPDHRADAQRRTLAAPRSTFVSTAAVDTRWAW